MARLKLTLPLLLLLFEVLPLTLPAIKAQSGCPAPSPTKTIFLPFKTTWNDFDALGTAWAGCIGAQVYQASNFYNPSGTGTAYLNLTKQAYDGFHPWTGSAGYANLSSQSFYLGAYGYFGGVNSFGILRLFDNNIGDSSVHFLLKSHTSLSVWYYHNHTMASRYAMIDGLLYNPSLNKFSSLGDFFVTDQKGTHYITDQNGTRLNAAYRTPDAVDTWLHSVFSLDLVYNNDPNWYVMGIWVRFDNSQSNGNTGVAVTFFSDLRFTYVVSQSTTYTSGGWMKSPSVLGPMVVHTAVEAWGTSGDPIVGNDYDLGLKVEVTSLSDAGSAIGSGGYWYAFPNNFTVNVPTFSCGCGVSLANTNQTKALAINLTNLDLSTHEKWRQYLWPLASDVASTLNPYVGYVLTAADVLNKVYELLYGSQPSALQGVHYNWPVADLSFMSVVDTSSSAPPAVANSASGETWISVNQLTANTAVSIPVTGTIQFASTFNRNLITSGSSQVSVPFSSIPDSNPLLPTASLSLSSAAQSLGLTSTYTGGGSTATTLTVTTSPYILGVTFSQQGKPWYLIVSFSPSQIDTSQSTTSTVTFTVQPNTKITSTQTYNIVITSEWAGLMSSVTIALTIYQNYVSGGSVLAGTLITMADSSQTPVQNIQSGMQILSYNPYANTLYAATVTTVTTKTVNDLYVIETNNSNPIRVDSAEEFWVQTPSGQTQWMLAGSLQLGYRIYRPVEGIWATVTSISIDTGAFTVYDLFINPTLTDGMNPLIANGYVDGKIG